MATIKMAHSNSGGKSSLQYSNFSNSGWAGVARAKNVNEAAKIVQIAMSGIGNTKVKYSDSPNIKANAKSVGYNFSKCSSKIKSNCSNFVLACVQGALGLPTDMPRDFGAVNIKKSLMGTEGKFACKALQGRFNFYTNLKGFNFQPGDVLWKAYKGGRAGHTVIIANVDGRTTPNFASTGSTTVTSSASSNVKKYNDVYFAESYSPGKLGRITKYYNYSWNYCFRATSDDVAERIAYTAQRAIDKKLVYHRASDISFYNALKKNNWDIEKVSGKYYAACTQFCAACVNAAGVTTRPNVNSNMLRQDLKANNAFTAITYGKEIDKSKLRRGDILISYHPSGKKHGVVVIGSGSNAKDPVSSGGSYTVTSSDGSTYSYSGSGEYLMDDGRSLVLTTIDTLYSTDEYQWVEQKEKEETEEEKKFKELTERVKQYYDNIRVLESNSAAVTDTSFSTNISTTNNFVYKPDIYKNVKNAPLLTAYPNFVEAPYIELDFNGVIIGGVGNTGDKYPNYVQSLQVSRINGQINQYTINLIYQIRAGEDPNFIDALLGKVGYTNPLRIRYGDSSSPGLMFKEENAIVTDVTYNENIGSSSISYTIQALSSIVSGTQTYHTFPEVTTKPSTQINNLLYNSGSISSQILKAFPAMQNQSFVYSNNLIPSNDSEVTIGGMQNVSPITYLGHAVSCMSDRNDNTASYFISYIDDAVKGSYFKINEVSKKASNDMYMINVGYPEDDFIIDFQLCDNIYWPLVYEYNGKIPKYEYNIDNNGNIISRSSNPLLSDNKFLSESLINSNWWKQITEFPISAKVVLKGVTVPIMLMSYIRINTVFYGQQDMASGLYVVTDQTDSISSSGCRTTLTLLRVSD